MLASIARAAERVLFALKRGWCGLRHGHDNLMNFEPKRISLRCSSCGYDSPGWHV